jgi:hypothetical protein
VWPQETQLQQDTWPPLRLHSTSVDVMHTSECRILSYHMPSVWDAVLNVDGTQHQASEGHEWRTARHPVSRTGLLKWRSHSCDKHVTQWNCTMTNVMHKFLIYLSIYFCLTCFGLSFSPSSEADVQFWQWFKSAGYDVSAWASPGTDIISRRLPLKMG